MVVADAQGRAEALADGFRAAAVGQASWASALDVLAAATGSRCAELVSVGAQPWHVITEVSPDDMTLFNACGGHDPGLNTWVRRGSRAAELSILDQAELESNADGGMHRPLADALETLEIPIACLTKLKQDHASVTGLSVLRTRRLGNIDRDQKRLFALGARHARTALDMHMALERRALELTLAGLEGLGLAALALDRSGIVRAWSEPAERLFRRGVILLVGGRPYLAAGADPAFARALEAARSAPAEGLPPRSVPTWDEAGVPFLIEVMRMPSCHDFPWAAELLVVAKPPRDVEAASVRLAAKLYGLTPTESLVAGLLATGLPPLAIADRLGIGIGTVRTHIHRTLEKSGTRGQVELVAALLSRL